MTTSFFFWIRSTTKPTDLHLGLMPKGHDGMDQYEGGKVELSWDNKWFSVVRDFKNRWVFEAAIPFKSIRYKKGITEWGINFGRNDLKGREK